LLAQFVNLAIDCCDLVIDPKYPRMFIGQLLSIDECVALPLQLSSLRDEGGIGWAVA